MNTFPRKLTAYHTVCRTITGICAFFAANCYPLIYLTRQAWWIPLAVWIGIMGNLLPLLFALPWKGGRLKACYHGTLCLQAFLFSTTLTVAVQIWFAADQLPNGWNHLLWSILLAVAVEAILFWNGILSVYLTSRRLGLKLRIIGILCGLIPIANLIALSAILRQTTTEVGAEIEKQRIDRARAAEECCHTRYPLLLIHGVFFRDTNFFNYWGRIPEALEKNGARIHYGNHPSASSVEASGKELAERIRRVVEETGCEKVNLIAHSKGGLDCRYAIAMAGAAPYVASLTTINTPHRGCEFADYLLNKMPESLQKQAEKAYNGAMRAFGEESSDFLSAVDNLTARYCHELSEALEAQEEALYADSLTNTPATAAIASADSTRNVIYRQSVGSRLDHASGGAFPLNFTYHLAAYFDGPNDGLVSEKSFQWGEDYIFLTPKGKNGISHGDMIDLNRVDPDGFDVREFYVELVSGLKQRGL